MQLAMVPVVAVLLNKAVGLAEARFLLDASADCGRSCWTLVRVGARGETRVDGCRTIQVTMSDLKSYDAMLFDLYASAVGTVEAVKLRVNDLRKLRDQAREIAMQAAEDKVQLMAKAMKRRVGWMVVWSRAAAFCYESGARRTAGKSRWPKTTSQQRTRQVRAWSFSESRSRLRWTLSTKSLSEGGVYQGQMPPVSKNPPVGESSGTSA